MAHENNTSACSVCLEPTEQRGGKPLYSPGCCGSWLHLECAYAMARSASCNDKCPQCRARITLPQAFNMQKINEITCRLRQGVLAMDSLLHPRPTPRVVTPPSATPPVSVPPRHSSPMSASLRTTVPALAPPTTSSRATIVLPRTAIAVPVTAVLHFSRPLLGTQCPPCQQLPGHFLQRPHQIQLLVQLLDMCQHQLGHLHLSLHLPEQR
jgi:hypothetical protein